MHIENPYVLHTYWRHVMTNVGVEKLGFALELLKVVETSFITYVWSMTMWLRYVRMELDCCMVFNVHFMLEFGNHCLRNESSNGDGACCMCNMSVQYVTYNCSTHHSFDFSIVVIITKLFYLYCWVLVLSSPGLRWTTTNDLPSLIHNEWEHKKKKLRNRVLAYAIQEQQSTQQSSLKIYCSCKPYNRGFMKKFYV